MEERQLHYAFREAVRMMLEVIREFAVEEYEVSCTVMGEQIAVPFSRKYMRAVTDGRFPIEHYINIKSARQTKYTRMMHNELMLQMMQIMGGNVDPVIMMEGLDYDGLELLLEKVRHAQKAGMVALQQQNAQLQQQLEQLSQENNQLNEALDETQKLLNTTEQRVRADAASQQTSQELMQRAGVEQQPSPQQPVQQPMGAEMTEQDMQGMLANMGG